MRSVQDVIQKPVIGAREEGASGLMKGLGKGLLGIVTRPTSSVANFAGTSCDVIRRYSCCYS